MISSLYIRYDTWFQWAVSCKKFSPVDTLLNTGCWKNLVIELIINMISPYPFLKGFKYIENVEALEFTVEYEINDILLVFAFVRLTYLFKLFLFTTIWMDPRSVRVCHINGCEANPLFAFKCVNKAAPYSTIGISLILSTIVFGYQLKLTEGPVSDVSGQDFLNLDNCMWNVVITLASIGYGEIYPKTYYGRIIGVIITFWGLFIVSAFVVTVTNMLEFNQTEEKSYNMIISLYYKKKMKE